MKRPIARKIYPLLYQAINEYSRNTNISEKEKTDIVLFLASMGFYAVDQTNKEEVRGFSMACKEFVEDYVFIRFLVPEFQGVTASSIAISHIPLSLVLRSEYGFQISCAEGIAIVSLAVKKDFVTFRWHVGGKLIAYHDSEKLCRLANSYLHLKRCFPNEPIHKTCLMAI